MRWKLQSALKVALAGARRCNLLVLWANSEDMLALVEDMSAVVGRTKRGFGSVVYVDEALWRTPIKCRQLKKKRSGLPRVFASVCSGTLRVPHP